MQFDELKAIGLSLAAWRKTEKFTQEELGKRVKIDRQTISDIERGKFKGSLAILLRYTSYAGFNIAITPKPSKYPSLNELGERYGDDDD